MIFTDSPADAETKLLAYPYVPLHKEAIQPLLSATHYLDTLLALIKAAKHRIYIAALYLEHDDAGQRILTALYEAQCGQPLLDICIFVDWHRAQRGRIGESSTINNAAWYQTIAQKYPNTIHIRGIPINTRELFGVFHMKGFVIDDQLLYTGASINNTYMNLGATYRLDRYHLIHQPVLADSLVAFMKQYFCQPEHDFFILNRAGRIKPSSADAKPIIQAFRQSLLQARYRLPQTACVGVHEADLRITPIVGVHKKNPFNLMLIQLFQTASRHIRFCTPYFNLNKSLIRELGRALKRGVTIDMVVGDKTASDFYVAPSAHFKSIHALPYLYERRLRLFAHRFQSQISSGQLNLHLWKDHDHSFHAKGLWIDDTWILLTGNNFNPRAFNLDLENGLLIHDPKQQLKSITDQELQSIQQHTTSIRHFKHIERLRDYPIKVKKRITQLSRFNLDRLLYRFL